jgi:phosphoglycolate phosphatase
VGLDLRDTTIVFDLDGTLVDTAPDLAAATNYALGLVGLAPITIAQLHPFIGHGSKAMIDAGLRLHNMAVTGEELTRLHDRLLEFYADNVAVASRPFEGVPELLDALLAAGARLAVCTNKFERLSKLLLRALALEGKFGAVAGRDTFAMFKPAPGHLIGTIEMAGGRADRAVMVGDSEVDIATAVAANVPSIGVTFGYTPRPVAEFGPDVVIDHYREFPAALARVLARTMGPDPGHATSPG